MSFAGLHFTRERNVENVEPRLIPSGPALSIQVRKLTLTDVFGSLRSGWDDFMAYPSHAVMLAIIYPIVGLSIARVLQGYSFLPCRFHYLPDSRCSVHSVQSCFTI
jgi:hypothetical protein